MSNQDVSTKDALRQMREIVVKEKKRKRPSRKQIPILVNAIEILIVLLQRQDLR